MGNASITFCPLEHRMSPMPASTSKLTSKYQATIPEPVRRLLGLKAGDTVAFDIQDGTVYLRKARPLDMAFAEAIEDTLGEWASDSDEEAYRGL
jgi:AbrB family looped-hinge helix DNA binding protein